MHTFIYMLGFSFLALGGFQQWRLIRIEKKVEDDKKKLEQDKETFALDVAALKAVEVMQFWREVLPLLPKDEAVLFQAKLVRRKYDESENVLSLDIGDTGCLKAATAEELLRRAFLLLNKTK